MNTVQYDNYHRYSSPLHLCNTFLAGSVFKLGARRTRSTHELITSAAGARRAEQMSTPRGYRSRARVAGPGKYTYGRSSAYLTNRLVLPASRGVPGTTPQIPKAFQFDPKTIDLNYVLNPKTSLARSQIIISHKRH